MNNKLLIFVPVRNLGNILEKTLDKIPFNFRDKINLILINDNNSTNETKKIISNYVDKTKLNITVNSFSSNIGFGGSKKKAYLYAINNNYDYVICLHGDGQYPPEKLEYIYNLLSKKNFDMVQGSRVNYLKGGMPFYKIFSNKVLNFIENLVFNFQFMEYHSGFRGYSCEALKKIPLEKLSNSHLITAEILAMAKIRKFKVKDFAIDTIYDVDSSSMKFFPALKYGINVFYVLINCFLSKYNLNFDPLYNKYKKHYD